MKPAALVVIAVFVALFVLTTFVESDEAAVRAAAYFSPDEIARGRQYTFERRLIMWPREAVHLALLCALAFSAGGRQLIVRCRAAVGERPFPAFLLTAAVCFVLERSAMFPFAMLGGWLHQRTWGLTDRAFGPWFLDWLKAGAVAGVTGAILAALLHGAMRLRPRTWWLPAALGAGLFGFVFAFVLPVVIAPLFNEFTPIGQTKYADFEPAVREMAAKAGVEVGQVLVVDASRQSRHANAYFTGFGPTRRIVLYDTLLAAGSREEVESIIGHEIGHWMHDHIVQGISLGTAGALVAFFAMSVLLRRAGESGRFGFREAHEAGAWPMILLLAYLGTWIALPIENAVSRHFERQADEAGLDLAGRPEAFIEAERRMVRQNIGNPAPNPFSVWLFASHPPVVERIEAAQRRLGGP
jgi:STE24 endopeptidase